MDPKSQLPFEEKWPSMRPIILKLLKQEPVTQGEWQDLFYSIYTVCLWDEKGAQKMRDALKEDIMDFIKQAQQMMLDSWNQSIFNDIKQRLQDSAMKLVRAERNGEAFDSQLVIGVRESYVNLCSNPNDKLQIYRENFEAAYIETTQSFYWIKAPEQLHAHGVEHYMRYAEAKLREEELRAQKYLEPNSSNLEDHISSAGLADMMAAVDVITQDSEKYVERLLEQFRRFSKLVKEAFDDDPRFLTARDKAYKLVVNDATVFRLELPSKQPPGATTVVVNSKPNNNNSGLPESKCPELLANYCDMLLRKTPLSKKLTSDEIESKLRDVLLVLKYVQNKDVFMRYHKAHLTRRLILDTSADSEKEENMVEWLREVGMPADYVNKLARMFQDIKVSQDLNQQFKEQCRAAIADIGRFDVDVTTFQMAVLFAWNQRPRDKVSYENLQLATELPDPELRRTLWSLCAFPKLKRQLVLVDPPACSPKDFSHNSKFWVNQEFAIIKNGKLQKRGRINLIGRLQLSTERSKEEDNQCIVQLRILRVQEAIIKILKMRKKITNAQLQTELVDILKNMFLPSKKMIKEQIEWLIEHKYIKRHEDDINTFVYMA
ncbi:hypothetical protein G9C98_003399 [Cotesia typhae]|uniref:Cullin-5 n=1 Tax=Cotesia typhae TaxID=2053667 RepID=A0A8J5US89_9HYME|nr:hypothetical protein G9C98_003399 [Cotesia typhae]